MFSLASFRDKSAGKAAFAAHHSPPTRPVNFKRYRQAAGYSESTIKVQDSHVNQLVSWCMAHSIDPGQITYNQVLQFIDHERARHIKRQSIAGMLNSLKVYFDFLVDTGVIAQNVFRP